MLGGYSGRRIGMLRPRRRGILCHLCSGGAFGEAFVMRGILAIIGLVLAGAGVAMYSWPAGLIVLGAGLCIDAYLGKSDGADN